MIQLDEIRSALSATDPSAALDALVRRELQAGHTPQGVYLSIKSLMPEVMRLPEHQGEVEADLHGIMDGLRGWCHPSGRYQADAPKFTELKPFLVSSLPRIEAIPEDGPAIAAAVRSLLAIAEPPSRSV